MGLKLTVSTSLAGGEPRYHHGGLRAAALDAGLALLEQRSGSVGLREVARAAGVSATALYRHFPDKAALLSALADEGLERLGAAQRAAQESAPGDIEGFNATGRAYVRFALANPALFRLIFAAQGRLADTPSRLDEPMRLLKANAAALVHPTDDGHGASILSVRAWALVHGLAVLMLDGLIPVDEKTIDQAVDAAGLTIAPRRGWDGPPV